MKKAVFPGSFDPLTLGHCDIINKSLDLFDEIIIAIGENSDKKNMFSMDERKKFIHNEFKNQKKLSIKDYPLSHSLTAMAFSGEAYDKKNRLREFELFGRINDLSQGCLRTGTAAMNLAYVSSGTLGACWGKANKYWDIAAGLLFARLSGAIVKYFVVDEKKQLVNYLAATPKCWTELEPIINDFIQLS